MNPIAVARGPTTVPDGVLVQEAAAGGGASYASLYDRYAEQVYNYCLRLTGSPDDAADATQDAFVNVLGRLQHDERPVLDFSSYLFAAARNESYALMRRRSRAQPTEDVPDRAASQPDLETDPERALLLRDSQEAVRQANSQLPPRHREVLALREVAGRSYDEIGEIMGISENAAAQLIFRARGKLKEAMTAGAVASVVAATDECEVAQLLINRLQDGELITDEEQEWLDDHLEHCGSCRAARGMLVEVGASYRAWAVVPVIAALRPEVLTRAGEVIGADWSGVAASGPGGSGGGVNGGGGGVLKPRGHHAAAQGAIGAAVLAVAGIVAAGILHDGSPMTRDAAPAETVRPAEDSSAAAAASADNADATANAAKATGIHGVQNAAAGVGPAERGLPNLPAGGPGKRASSAPGGGERGSSPNGSPGPNGGQPKPGNPKPGQPKSGAPEQPGGGPGSAPGGGQPGSGAPATPPGGGQADPPGLPTDPGTRPPPPEPPPAGGGDCTWPGHGGGPGGCPPGHGGTPPGHGGTPPGQGKKPG